MLFGNNHFIDTSTECTELEWKIFLGITTLGLLENIQNLYLQCEPEHFNERIIFMSVYNDNVWQAKRNKEQCEHKSLTVADYARKFPRGHWSFLGPGSEEKWDGTYTDNPDRSWDRMAEEMMANFSGSGHPRFRVTSAFERGELGCKRGGKKTLHFNGGHERISANKLSIYGAIADVCDEVPKGIRAPGKLAAPQHMEKMEIPHRLLYSREFYQSAAMEKPSTGIRAKNRTFVQKLSKLCSDAGFEVV